MDRQILDIFFPIYFFRLLARARKRENAVREREIYRKKERKRERDRYLYIEMDNRQLDRKRECQGRKK